MSNSILAKLPTLVQFEKIIKGLNKEQLQALTSALEHVNQTRGEVTHHNAWEEADAQTFGVRDPNYHLVQAIRRLAIDQAERVSRGDNRLAFALYDVAEGIADLILIRDAGRSISDLAIEIILEPWEIAKLPLEG
jgi:hypothetical protein